MGTPLDTYITAQKRLVNKTLLKLLRKSGAYKKFSHLDKSFSHTVLLNGKRLRPIMALMTYELFKKDDSKKILEPACAIELIHAGSLMLDDMPSMDNAEYRRGKKTSHAMYGDAVTILASAGLWVEAFHIIGSADTTDTKALISAATECIGKDGLVLGQYMDLYAFNKQQSLKDLRHCYELKTASLFKLSVIFGAVLGGADTKQTDILKRFATAFGIAYQIRDDIIDATDSEKESGKDAHKDEQNNKPNYVSLLGLDGAKKALHKELTTARKAIADLHKDTVRFEQLLEAITL